RVTCCTVSGECFHFLGDRVGSVLAKLGFSSQCLKEFQPSKNPNPSRGRDSQRVIIGKNSPPGYCVISKFEHLPLHYSNSFWAWKNQVKNLQNCLSELHHSKNPIRVRRAIGTYSQEEQLNSFMNMEVLEADFMQIALNEEIEAQNNCLDDEKEFGPISSSRDDHHLIQVNFTKDIHDTKKLIQKKSEARSQIVKKLNERTFDLIAVNTELHHLSSYRDYLLWRRNEMETLQQCLKEFRPSKNPNPSRGRDSQKVIIGKRSPVGYHAISRFKHLALPYSNSFWTWKNEFKNLQNCLEELHHSKNPIRVGRAIGTYSQQEQLNCFIKSLNHRMQHGSNSLAEEKKLLREIKQNEAKMDNIKLNNNNTNIVNHAWEAPQIRYYLGTRKDIRDHIQG
ncbi:Proton pump-interactor BIP131, partial [Camellia lanceoleosa]